MVVRALVGGIVVWGLWLPLSDILRFPNRLSVFPNLETDAAAYYAFARDFAASWQLAALPSKHPPGWMVMLAAVRAIAGESYVAGKLISWGALVLAVALCAWLARRVYGRAAAAVAAILCATSPGLRAYVGTLQYEVVTGALLMLLLVLATRICDAAGASPPTGDDEGARLRLNRDGVGPAPLRGAIRRASLAGVAAAALVLTRETFVLVVPLVAWWVWRRLQRTIDRRSALRIAAVLIVVAAAPPVLWSAAQTRHHERLIIISEKGPKEFQLGNNPLANGTYNEPLVGIAEPSGFAYVRAFPIPALQLAARKVLYFFGVLRDGWNVPHPAAVWMWRATTGALPLAVIEPVARGGWLLAICLIALYLTERDSLRQWWILPATVGAILGVHVITLASYRFAIPALPVLYVIASSPIAAAARALVPALRTPVIGLTGILILALAVAAQFRPWPLQTRYDAVDLDGIAATNEIDDLSGAAARHAGARFGERPMALLPDTYLPAGPLVVTVRMRRTSVSGSETTPVARVVLLHVDGHPACVEDVPGGALRTNGFADVSVRCRLERDGPATLAVHNLGQVDLAIDGIRLKWN